MESELFNKRIFDSQLENLPASGLRLDLTASSLLLTVYMVFFILILVSLILLPISIWLIVILLISVSAYFQFIFRKNLLLNHPESIDKLVFTDMDWCFVLLKNNTILKASILPNSILTEHLVILNLKSIVQKNYFFGHSSLLITSHSVANNQFWQLKRYLRFKKFNSELDHEKKVA